MAGVLGRSFHNDDNIDRRDLFGQQFADAQESHSLQHLDSALLRIIFRIAYAVTYSNPVGPAVRLPRPECCITNSMPEGMIFGRAPVWAMFPVAP